MDNVVQAIFMAFAMFVLVIGLSASAYLINKMNTAATAVIRANDKTLEYQTVSYDSSNLKSRNKMTDGGATTRTVSSDVVISTLYRYYKENFAVEIYDEKGLNQLFDLSVETKMNKSVSVDYKTYDAEGNIKSIDPLNPTIVSDPLARAYNKNYNNPDGKSGKHPEYMWKAPWLGSARDIEERIDLYVSSKKGYINGSLVDYSLDGYGFKNLKNKKFTEQFIQYTYDGDTYTDTNGEDVETLVGNQQELKKILIVYKAQ